MKNKLLFIVPFLLLLSGCTTTIPDKMVATINLFYNMLLFVGYLSIFSVVLGGETKWSRFWFGAMWVLAVYCALFLSNIYFDHNYFKIGLPYFWPTAR
ncbi:hypothetical protein R4576_18025 [Acinetobacter baumannii]|nr:hypothetical protein [Acinetobacter baumannii]